METQTTKEFNEFMDHREAASNDYIRGNAQSVAELLTRRDPATFMPPHGAIIEGAASVEAAQVEGASAFGPGSSGHFEVLNSGASGDLAFWTGRQVSTIQIKGKEELVPMILRTTEVFRREDGQWKLIHRHADTPAPPKD